MNENNIWTARDFNYGDEPENEIEVPDEDEMPDAEKTTVGISSDDIPVGDMFDALTQTFGMHASYRPAKMSTAEMLEGYDMAFEVLEGKKAIGLAKIKISNGKYIIQSKIGDNVDLVQFCTKK